MNQPNSLTKAQEKLIQRCIKQDRKAQKELYQGYAPGLFAVALRYCKTHSDAEDVLQDAFLKIFQKISTFKGEGFSFEGWMKRIVVNTALNHNRGKIYQQPQYDVEILNFSHNTETMDLSTMDFDSLIDLIRSLPMKCQTIFNLYAIEGYQHKEIAEMLQITEGTSKSQYARAKLLLQAKIMQTEEIEQKLYSYASGR